MTSITSFIYKIIHLKVFSFKFCFDFNNFPTKGLVHLQLFRPFVLYDLEQYNGQNPSIVGDQETSSNSAFVTILNLKDTQYTQIFRENANEMPTYLAIV